VVLKQCCRRRCCKSNIETILKTLLKVEVVLQKMSLQNITSASMANKCTSIYLFTSLFSLLFTQMMASWEAYRHFLVFFSCGEDDDEPLSSLSYLGFFLKCRIWQRAWRLLVHCPLLGFFSSVSSLATSQLDASLLYLPIRGDVTTPLRNAKVRRKGGVRYITIR
jgi:hypothetical protein